MANSTNLNQYFTPNAIEAMTDYFQAMIDESIDEAKTDLQNSGLSKPAFMNLGRAAKEVSMSRTTLRTYIKHGDIKVVTPHDTTVQRIEFTDLQAFMRKYKGVNTNKRQTVA